MTDQSSDSDQPYNIKDQHIRAAINVVSGVIPLAGGFLSAIASAWSEKEQEEALATLRAIIKMLEDDLREKHQTIIEVISRLDMHDEEIRKRVRSDEYQSLLKKAFRNWAGTESRKKQEYIRNLLSNAASVRIVDDDVIKLFIEWLQKYSELHFAVIAVIYNQSGITRDLIWSELGKKPVREDSAEADLFKFLMRDLSMGQIIRQHREVDNDGKYLKKSQPRSRGQASSTMKSAFDDGETYELTALGEQFVHYAMTEVTVKIEYKPHAQDSQSSQEAAA